MEVIITQSGKGGTLRLIKRSLKTRETIVVTTEAEKISIQRIAKALAIDIPEPVVFTDLVQRDFLNSEDGDPFEKGLLLDDVESMLRSLFRCNIKSISINERDSINEDDEISYFEEVK